MEERKAHRKVRTGTVVSDKMEKTIVVRVDRMAKIGETRPLSARKRWEVLEIVERAPILGVAEEEAE